MNRKLAGVLVLGVMYMSFLTVTPSTHGQESADSTKPNSTVQDQEKVEKEWTGMRYDGSILTRADLDEILRKHKLWVETDKREGERANLTDAYLIDANLSGVNLNGADLIRANLTYANLSGANLASADLIRAILGGANLSGANLASADLSWAKLNLADLRGAKLTGAKLIAAELMVANLSGAELLNANLNGAELINTDLSGAFLYSADLSGALIMDTYLTNANMTGVNFDGTMYEPMLTTLPYIPFLASARNLDKLQYSTSPAGLVELRTALREAGLRRREREVNYAILHNRYEKMWENPNGIGDLFDAALNYILFEHTYKYGMLPARPLQIMVILVLVFAFPYFRVLRRKHRRSRSDIWLDFADESISPNRDRKRRFRVLLYKGPATKFRGRIKRFRRTVFAAIYFSLLTSFRVGFREINVGNWITRMQCREYTLRATGWVRFITGVQSLISVYLLALWLMTYFGRPFE